MNMRSGNRKRWRTLGTVLFLVIVCTRLIAEVFVHPVWFPGKEENRIHADTTRLRADVAFLTGLDTPRNYLHASVLEQVEAYIHDSFINSGGRVERQPVPVGETEYANVICFFGPDTGTRIIVGAHYDVCDNLPGADDNASGVAGLLELARHMKAHEAELKYRIDLVAYTLEEPPFFRSEYMGSAVHARSLHENGVKVKGMICLEMIGYFSDAPASQSYPIGLLKWIYPAKGDFIMVVGKVFGGSLLRHVKKSMMRGSDVDVRSISAPTSIPGIDFSDHLNYWKYHYPAVLITNTAFYRNHAYHTEEDTSDRLDYARMAEVVSGVFNAVLDLGGD
ncbi:MAG: M28 family peptidase [Flavobacteriales bacterium]|nr:M28 family peptidase [Flavobacteriales bacterium]